MTATMKNLHGLAAIALAALIAACAVPPPATDYHALVASPGRSDADRATDVRRKPAELLAFYGVRPGMRVLDLSAGAGYNTELLARAVGPTGRVYAQNSPRAFSESTQTRLNARLKNPVADNVVPIVRDFDSPLPDDVHDLDLVTFNFNYHDTAWMGVDRAAMNRAVYRALRAGGVYIVADHSGRPGTGASEAKSLHRIEEGLVKREVEAAGFRLAGEGGFLRNPDDPRDAPVFKPKQPNDEFVLKFVKP
jgi:predicted methyltransferase